MSRWRMGRPSRRVSSLALGTAVTTAWPYSHLSHSASGTGMCRPERKVVGEMVAADGNDRGVGDGALEEDDEFGRAGADVDEADAEFALVGGDDGLGGGDRLEDGLSHFKASAVAAGNDALQHSAGAGGEMQVDFEASADHADGIVDAGLFVEQELLRQQVDDFAIGGKRNRAGAVDSGANIFTGDLAQAGAEADAAAAVDAANVLAADADDTLLNDSAGELFSDGGGFVDGLGRRGELGDQAFADSFRVDDRVGPITQSALMQLGH